MVKEPIKNPRLLLKNKNPKKENKKIKITAKNAIRIENWKLRTENLNDGE